MVVWNDKIVRFSQYEAGIRLSCFHDNDLRCDVNAEYRPRLWVRSERLGLDLECLGRLFFFLATSTDLLAYHESIELVHDFEICEFR